MAFVDHAARFRFASAAGPIAFAVVLFASGCGGDSTTAPSAGPAAHFDIAAGNDQSAVAGTELTNPLVVKVTDAQGRVVKGQVVNFRVVSGGGSVFAGSGASNDSGIVKERWTLGLVATDSQRVEGRAVDGITGAPIVFGVFRATALAGPAARIAKSSGDGQSALAGNSVSVAPSVKITDANGNIVAGASVAFAVASGGGSVTGANQTSSSTGVATVGSWTLGVTGANTLTATATGLTGSPVTFSATALSNGPVARVNIAPLSFGILVGDTVTLSATAYDASDNLVGGFSTVWVQPAAAASLTSSGFLTGVSAGGGPLKATIGGVTGPSGGGGFTVYTALDSVRFIYTDAGALHGWTETTLAVGSAACHQLITMGPFGLTSALRWTPSVSDSTILSIEKSSQLPQAHCVRALRSGTVTVFGAFGGKTGQKTITIP